MADYEFPQDLLDQQQAYWTADDDVQKALAGKGKKSPAEARKARLLALEAMNRNPWWEQAEVKRDRHAAWMALQAAAKALRKETTD